MRRARRGQRGYALVALVAATTVMLIMMGAAVPAWRYVVKNEREEELLFRGEQIAHAIARYQERTNSAFPVSLEVLVKGRYLRRAYKDPTSADGQWRYIRPGEPIIPDGRPDTNRPGSPPGTLVPGQSRGGPGGQASRQAPIGPFMGVASLTAEKSLRIFNGRENYKEWLFTVHSLRGPHPQIGRLPPHMGGRPGAPPVFPTPPGGSFPQTKPPER